MNKTVQAVYRDHSESRGTDALLEIAIEAAANVARAFGDSIDANRAWDACLTRVGSDFVEAHMGEDRILLVARGALAAVQSRS